MMSFEQVYSSVSILVSILNWGFLRGSSDGMRRSLVIVFTVSRLQPRAVLSTVFTSQPVTTFTPASVQALRRVSTTSPAIWDSGKARSPRSTTLRRPLALNSSMSFSGVRLCHAGLTKLVSVRTWSEKSPHSLTLVKLHRPLPVIITFRPALGIFSSTVTVSPLPVCANTSAAPRAATRPEAPPPITMISDFIDLTKISAKVRYFCEITAGSRPNAVQYGL